MTYVDETFRYDISRDAFSADPPQGWCVCGHRVTSHDGECKAWLRYPDVLTARACGCGAAHTRKRNGDDYRRPDGLSLAEYDALTPEQKVEANRRIRDAAQNGDKA